MQWYLKVLRDYATFTGRARRTEYWMFTLFSIIASIVLRIVDALIGTSDLFGTSPQVPAAGIGLLSSIYGLAVLVPTLAVTARRLHDTGRSGWWQALLLVYLIALIPNIALALIGSLAGLVVAILLIVWLATDGQPGPNEHGVNPKTLQQPV